MPGKRVVEKVEAKQTLTAVLLADSFTQRFRPITVERPKVLLPLVNAPLLEYTLEWLAYNKVEEIFVFCCAHADLIRKYLQESKWLKQREPKITTIVSTNCLSAGEALRSLDQKDIIKSDFILVSGDSVSNMKLAPALAAHRARREKDKNAIMTMVLKSARDPFQRLRLGDTGLIVAVDPTTQRLLKYAELDEHGAATAQSVKIDAALFSERDDVQLRYDLLDTNITICAPEVLMLFSDNFDYQNLRKDFVTGVLSEEELGNKLYVYELQGEYAARVHNLRSYDAISRDILQRWAYPFVPDTNVFQKAGAWGASSYKFGRHHRYLEAGASIPRSVNLGVDVCIGAGTSIGDGSNISHSVIGRNCRIGKNVTLQGAYLQDDVTVGEGACVTYSLLCERVVIRPGAKVQSGAVLSYGVVIGAKHTVPHYARVSLCKQLQSQVSFSDDELEYTTAHRTSNHGAEGGSRANSVHEGSGAGDDDDEREEDEEAHEADGADYDDDDFGAVGRSMEMPSELAMRAAEALSSGKAPADKVFFDTALVGEGGAGYEWPATDGLDVVRFSIAPPPMKVEHAAFDDNDSDNDAASVAAGDATTHADELTGGEGAASAGARGAEDPELSFKEEVSETFLRCVKMRFDQTNAVIELNGLKIAENRTFADCARYILTTMLSLCLPAPKHMTAEYKPLFPAEAPDVSSHAGKRVLLTRFQDQAKDWGSLLQRFLRTEDDQVELLLTLEEYCSEEGVFESTGEQGHYFAAVFPQLLQLLYEDDVVAEEAFHAWADEKEHADESERVYLKKAAPFIEWLRTADEDEDDEDAEEEEGDE